MKLLNVNVGFLRGRYAVAGDGVGLAVVMSGAGEVGVLGLSSNGRLCLLSRTVAYMFLVNVVTRVMLIVRMLIRLFFLSGLLWHTFLVRVIRGWSLFEPWYCFGTVGGYEGST